MSARPLISVIIPAFNAAPWVAESIESVLAQKHDPIEILVCDDASTDDTAKVVEGFRDKVTLVRQDQNRGVGAARNRLLQIARGQLICFHDADDLWVPGKIDDQLAIMTSRPEVTLCHTAYDRFGDPADTRVVLFTQPDQIMEGRCFEKLFLINNNILTISVMVRRGAIPGDGFELDMPVSEDYCMWLQIMMPPDRVAAYIPRVYVRYRRHGQNTTGQGDKINRMWNGLARLRALDHAGAVLEPARREELRRFALDDLKQHVYSRYWNKDFPNARRGFAWLRAYGTPIPLRHRLRARLGG